jgi:hypothetical protein
LERLKTTLLLLLLLSCNPLIFAQNKDPKQEFNTLLSSNPETLFLHCNTTTFVTGETLQYKLYSLNPTAFVTSPVSQIAYVELIGEDSKRIYIQKLHLENGIGQGDFFVPTTLKTGRYKLVAYTYWMLNKPTTTLFQLDLAIINPFQKNEKEAVTTVKELPSLDNKKIVKNTTIPLPILEKKLPIKSSKKTATTTASKFAYVELIGEDSKSVFTQKLTLENGIAQGNLFIPSDIKTGNYKLIVNTNSIANNTTTAPTLAVLPVVNAYPKNEPAAKNTTKDLPSLEKVENTEKQFPALEKESPINSDNQTTETAAEKSLFALQLDKKTAIKREKFVLKINTVAQQIQKGNYSISVRKTDQLATEKQPTATEFKNKWLKKTSSNETSEKEIIVPELRGEIVTGSITAKNGSSSLLNKTIALSIPGKSYTFRTTNTNASGQFIFNLDKTNYGSNLVLQIINEDHENYTVQLDQPKDLDPSLLHYKSNFELSPDMQNNILERSVACQIENAYYYKKTDSLAASKTTDDFFKSVAKVYILDDYTRFPSLQETITEVLFEAYYKQTENEYSIGVRDFNDNYEIPGSALVLVDGLLLQDYKELFKYNTKNIYKVSIITGGYYYGSRLFNGVISFTTFEQDFVSKQSGTYILDTTFLRPAVKKEYFSPDYTDKSKNKRIPDQRYQLLWLPQVTLPNTENSISFYTSDVTGTFEITLEGFTDQGIPVSLKDTFEVQ